jgi:hypothetical protein
MIWQTMVTLKQMLIVIAVLSSKKTLSKAISTPLASPRLGHLHHLGQLSLAKRHHEVLTTSLITINNNNNIAIITIIIIITIITIITIISMCMRSKEASSNNQWLHSLENHMGMGQNF